MARAQPDSSVRVTALEANDVSRNAKIVTEPSFVSFQCAWNPQRFTTNEE